MLALLAAPAAHAFTMDDQTNTNGDGTAKFSDPNDRLTSKFGNGSGQTVIKQGNTTLQFGVQPRSQGQRYDFNSQFDRYNAGSAR